MLKEKEFAGFSVQQSDDLLPEFAKNIRLDIEFITPEIAWSYLESNTENYRDPVMSNQNKINSDMKNGRWRFTHQAIAFTEDGTLLDGQHRLQGIVETGESQWFLVVRGMPNEQKKNPVIDQIVPRQAGLILKKEGYRYPHDVAAFVRFLDRLARGQDVNARVSGMSNSAIHEIVDKYPAIVDYIAKVKETIGKTMMTSVATAWYLFAREEDENAADECLRILGGGEASTTHAFAALREACLSRVNFKAVGHDCKAHQYELIAAAWERRNKPVQVLRRQSAPDQWRGIAKEVFNLNGGE